MNTSEEVLNAQRSLSHACGNKRICVGLLAASFGLAIWGFFLEEHPLATLTGLGLSALVAALTYVSCRRREKAAKQRLSIPLRN